MNWTTQLGFKLLFWLADALIGDSVSDDKRRELRSIATSFSVESKFSKAA